ncbi:MAG: hypothetical protein R3B96_09035 [Pirellulaceae bacterium]
MSTAGISTERVTDLRSSRGTFRGPDNTDGFHAPPSIRSAPATDSNDVTDAGTAFAGTTKAPAVLPLEQQRLIATRFEELVTWSSLS